MTLSVKNINRPAPVTFTKVDKAVSILSNASIIILLALGFKDNSLIMLLCKVGISGIMQAIGALLGEDTPVQQDTDSK